MLMATTVIPALPLAQIFFTGLVPLLGHMMRIGVSSFFAYYPPSKDSEDPCDSSNFSCLGSKCISIAAVLVWAPS